MNLLALDASSKTASCAFLRDNILVSEFFTDAGLTHSQTIMSMIEKMLLCANISLPDVDVFAVTTGPGSFTGLRIGISSVKGMAMATEKPCIGISTLHALAINMLLFNGYIATVLDARCQQVYSGIFKSDGKNVTRIQPDCAQSISDFFAQLQALPPAPIVLVGDGALLCNSYPHSLDSISVAPQWLLGVRGASVALAAHDILKETPPYSAEILAPQYMRLPQAQRELLQKQGRTL